METSGDCVIPQKKRNASNDSAVELDKDGGNSVKEESDKQENWIESEDHTGDIISQQTNCTEVYFTENEFERTSHDYPQTELVGRILSTNVRFFLVICFTIRVC